MKAKGAAVSALAGDGEGTGSSALSGTLPRDQLASMFGELAPSPEEPVEEEVLGEKSLSALLKLLRAVSEEALKSVDGVYRLGCTNGSRDGVWQTSDECPSPTVLDHPSYVDVALSELNEALKEREWRTGWWTSIMIVDWSRATAGAKMSVSSATEVGVLALGELLQLQSREPNSGFVRNLQVKGSLALQLRRDQIVEMELKGGAGFLVFGVLIREALRMRPARILSLVDVGFRVPFLDPAGVVPWDTAGEPRAWAGDEPGPEKLSALGEVPTPFGTASFHYPC